MMTTSEDPTIDVMEEEQDPSVSANTVFEDADGNVAIGRPAGERRSKRGRYTLMGVVAVLSFAIILGLSIGLSSGSGGNREPAATNGSDQEMEESMPSFTPTAAPTETRMSTVQEVQDYMVDQGVSTRQAVTTQGSAQYAAALWLANSDRANLPVPDEPVSNPDAYEYMIRYVLATLLYSTVDQRSWVLPMSFLSPRSICLWNFLNRGGLYCDKEGVPRILFLNNNGLSGTLPPELGALTTLEQIHISGNALLDGPVPTELCQLPLLETLRLGGNALTGPIPECIDQLPILDILDFQNNRMNGVLPNDALCTLSLSRLILDYNKFEGQIPGCIADWPNLETFSISNNLFTGPFPAFGQNRALEFLSIDDNMLTGDIAIFDGLRQIEYMYIEDNRFGGSLDSFGTNFPVLRALDMSSNNITSLTGVPVHIFDLPSLEILDLSNNQLSGAISSIPIANQDLTFLALHDNSLNGIIPPELSNLRGLQHLDLSRNEFTGPMPSELGELEDLEYLFLAENPGLAQGPIPTEYVALVNLEELSLKKTNRAGQLPDFLSNLPALNILDLDTNDFSGAIPASWGGMDNLGYLLLNRNPRISGSLPASFANLQNLRFFFLDATGLTGSLDVVCQLAAFNSNGDGLAISDCGGTTCTCQGCYCCDKVEGGQGCSLPQTINLDLQWEYDFGAAPRTFGLDDAAFANPGN